VTDPGNCSLNDPSLRYDLESACVIRPFDDLDRPAAGSSCRCRRFRTLVAAISKDAFDEREQTAGALVEHQCDAVAILDVGRMNSDAQQEAERVNQDVALAPRDLLACIVTLRVERRPPF